MGRDGGTVPETPGVQPNTDKPIGPIATWNVGGNRPIEHAPGFGGLGGASGMGGVAGARVASQ